MNRTLTRDDLEQAVFEARLDMAGVARIDDLSGFARLDEWLKLGFHGEMDYMARLVEKRLDPALLLENAVSIIVVFQNYYQHSSPGTNSIEGVISRYAWGQDYHTRLKDRLYRLAISLFGELEPSERKQTYRVFVDSAPVMEKVWAQIAGLGWQGKHTNLITRELGSWGFLGVILTIAEFDEYDEPALDHCGTCTACIDACPTNAIVEPYLLDAAKCISYGTIELKAYQEIPAEIRSGMGDWLFGCDICQDVCPWNRFAEEHQTGDYVPLDLWRKTPEEFIGSGDDADLRNSPLARPGIAGLKRNLDSRNVSQ